jgi:hypothetical protein
MYFLVGAAGLVITMIWSGFVVATLWGWFVVPLGLKALTLAHGVGIAALAGTFLGGRGLTTDLAELGKKQFLIYGIGIPLVMLAIGFGAKLFI